jgi:hypothetical protein
MNYTQDDLVHEAGRQYHLLGNGGSSTTTRSLMYRAPIESTVAMDGDEADAQPWGSLKSEELLEAQNAVATLLRGASDVGAWAVSMGQVNLEASGHEITLSGKDDEPIMRIHFAFREGMSEEEKASLVLAIGTDITRGAK